MLLSNIVSYTGFLTKICMEPSNTFSNYNTEDRAEAVCKITKTLGFHLQKRYYYSPQSLQAETFPPFFSASKHSLLRIPRWHHQAAPVLSPPSFPGRFPSPSTLLSRYRLTRRLPPARLIQFTPPSRAGIRENHLLLVLAGGVASTLAWFRRIFEVAVAAGRS
jgi:hypothetical protein